MVAKQLFETGFTTYHKCGGVHCACYAIPCTIAVTLLRADTGTELTGGTPAYARKAISFGTEANGTVAGSIIISGCAASITHYGIRDASTAGNLLYYNI